MRNATYKNKLADYHNMQLSNRQLVEAETNLINFMYNKLEHMTKKDHSKMRNIELDSVDARFMARNKRLMDLQARELN